MEAQNQLGVCRVKSKDLNQDSDVATEIPSRHGKHLRQSCRSTFLGLTAWDGGAFKGNRDH